MKKPIAIIDCAIKDPATDSFNYLVEKLNYPMTYHRPSTNGMDSLIKSNEARAYIIFGSDSSVNDRISWQVELSKFMKEKCEQYIPVMGICFGHQLMADSFGSTIGRSKINSNEKNIYKGGRAIKINTDVLFFEEGQQCHYIVAHGEEIISLSDELLSIASSKEIKHEAVVHKNLPYIGVQGHPEATSVFVKNEIPSKIDENLLENCFADGFKLIESFVNYLPVWEAKRGRRFNSLKFHQSL